MKFRMLVLFSVLFLPALCFGQAWSGILSPSRAIDWSQAGLPPSLPDGETIPNRWTPPTRTQCGSTVTAGTSWATVFSLWNACANGTYLLLGPGTFNVDSQQYFRGKSVSIRGSGPMQTTLEQDGTFHFQMGAASGGGSDTLTSDSNYAQGSTVIKVSGTSPGVGNIIELDQCDTGLSGVNCTTGTLADNGGVFVCGDNATVCSTSSRSSNNRHLTEVFYVTAVTSLGGGLFNVTLDHGLIMPNWAFARTPVITWQDSASAAIGIGVENLTIHLANTFTYNNAIEVFHAYGSWVKGVRLLGGGASFSISMGSSVRSLVANNYIFGNIYLTTTYPPNGIDGSLLLNINNIMLSGNYWFGGGVVGTVNAYNFNRDMFTQYTENSFFDHNNSGAFRLDEGNFVGNEHEDNTWGTHNFDTYFRNNIRCTDDPYNTWTNAIANRAMQVNAFQRFANMVGNAIGVSGTCTNYQSNGAENGVIFKLVDTDPLTINSGMRWGNVSVVQQSTDTPANSGIRFVNSEAVPATLTGNAAPFQASVPGSTNLPASFFLPTTAHPNGGTGLSWWRVCTTWTTFPTSCGLSQTLPFPYAGPDVTGGAYVNGFSYDNPASLAWRTLPIDTSKQISYTITSSSWSAGVMTLNVSGLPADITHLMGAFQITGANTACYPSSGVSFTGRSDKELLMTGSSTTQIKYALASNPGLSCTGTFKFPDIRQFDEQVYQADPTSIPWSGIISPARAVDWSVAGLPAILPTGETTPNPWTPPTRTQCGSTLSSGASLATIEAALAACTPGHYVLLGPGTFTVSSGQVLAFYDTGTQAPYPGVSLRGSGPMQTFLNLQGLIQYGQVFPGGSATISNFPTTSSVTLSTVTGLTVGNMLDINQCDTNRSGSTCQTGTGADNGGVWICTNLGSCSINVLATSNSSQHQMVTVTGIAGNVVSFSPPLRLSNWSTGNSPRVDWLTNKYHSNGIENMTIDERGNTNGSPIFFRNAFSSWMRGVRFIGANNANNFQAVVVSDCKNCLYANNYLFNNALDVGGSRITIDVGNLSDSLLVNNIQDGGDSLEGEGGSSASVIAYNYGVNGKTEYYFNAFYEHDSGSTFWLQEGNQNGKYQEDATNGTHNLNTLFRNYYTSWDPPYLTSGSQCNAASCSGIKIDPGSRFDNLIGNAVGGPTVTNYIANQSNGISNNYAFGFNLNFTGLNDPLTQQSAMLWGNCDTGTNTCRFQSSEVPTSLSGNAAPYVNSVPGNTNLPASFFLGNSAPSWWSVCTSWSSFPGSCTTTSTPPYPIAGPDVTGGPYIFGHAYDNPAAVAFNNLPIDPAYQNSYSITGSSWSSGTMTLTVSGLPTGSHTMGGFQITGNVNCNSPANTEFKMTGSSTTQIQYALASNPGSCAGGTMKWPDVRKFDAQIYQLGAGGATPNPPTNLAGTVQ